jgi:phage terminase large subunit-like protein
MAAISIIDFIDDVLVNPETGKPFELYPAQARFFEEAFTLTPDGAFRYPEMLLGACKKDGKTTSAAMAVLYVQAIIGGRHAEIICAANDFEQAAGRIFQACVKIIQASPLLRRDCRITATRIEYLPTGGTVTAVALDYKGQAGANPTLTVVDEPWGITSLAGRRMFDELVPSPARKLSGRLSVSHAGFTGESDVLFKLYQRGLKGEEIAPSLYAQPGMLMQWSHTPQAPWTTPAFLDQMRQQLPPAQFLRMYCNEFTSGESSFATSDQWQAVEQDGYRPIVSDPALSTYWGLDASVKHDSTAIVGVTYDFRDKRVRMVAHKIFQPTPDQPLDFEATVEATLLNFSERFRMRAVYFDPYQLQNSAQRLRRAGVPMVEFPQSVPNITEASTNLFELIRDRNLVAYADDAFRRSIARCVAKETPRGWHITKARASHKIDCIVALSMAALAAVRASRRYGSSPPPVMTFGSLGYLDARHRFRPTSLTNLAGPDARAQQQELVRMFSRPPLHRDGVSCGKRHPPHILEAPTVEVLTEAKLNWRCPVVGCGLPTASGTTESKVSR